MIRHPLYSAGSRTTAGLARVSDGIAASLRAFSTAQQLAAPQDDDNGNGNGNGFRATGKQRSAAAFAEISSMMGGNNNKIGSNNMITKGPPRGGEGRPASSIGFKKLDLGPRGPDDGSNRPPPSRVLDLRSAGASPTPFSNSNVMPRPTGPPKQMGPGEGNIIRAPPSGFRGRGGMNRGGGRRGRGGMGGGGGGGGGGGMDFERFGGGGGVGGRGRERSGRGDGGGGGGGGGTGTLEPPTAQEEAEGTKTEVDTDETEVSGYAAKRELIEMGEVHAFQPSLSKSDLAGWGAAVPVAKSSFAHDEIVLRQARVLGGGQPFHPLNTVSRKDLNDMYSQGNGTFHGSQEAKDWALKERGLKRFPPVPQATKDAVLEAALLGTYEGPQYAEPNETLAVVQNYVKRDASWNAEAERRIHAKIKSLLPGGGAKPAPAPTRAKA